MHIKIKKETFLEILYFLNWFLRHLTVGGAGEYNRLSRLVWKMYRENMFDNIVAKQFPAIFEIIRHMRRIERIEKNG